jgi:hypothetical protein
MSQTRIYLPLDADALRRLAAQREIGTTVLDAFAVTAWVERSLPEGDREDWEYAALAEAVDAAGALRAGMVARRVVAAADVDSESVRDGGDGMAGVRVGGPVPLSRVVAFHIDETAGDEGMADLLWYDATELAEVVRLL